MSATLKLAGPLPKMVAIEPVQELQVTFLGLATHGGRRIEIEDARLLGTDHRPLE